MNGSFLLENRNDGVYLQVKKADNGGVMPRFEELMYYMDKKKVPYGTVVELDESSISNTFPNDSLKDQS